MSLYLKFVALLFIQSQAAGLIISGSKRVDSGEPLAPLEKESPAPRELAAYNGAQLDFSNAANIRAEGTAIANLSRDCKSADEHYMYLYSCTDNTYSACTKMDRTISSGWIPQTKLAPNSGCPNNLKQGGNGNYANRTLYYGACHVLNACGQTFSAYKLAVNNVPTAAYRVCYNAGGGLNSNYFHTERTGFCLHTQAIDPTDPATTHVFMVGVSDPCDDGASKCEQFMDGLNVASYCYYSASTGKYFSSTGNNQNAC